MASIENKVSNGWSEVIYEDDYLRDVRRRPVLSHITFQEVVLEKGREVGGGRLLDLACGNGALLAGVEKKFFKVFSEYVGVDASSVMLEQARRDFHFGKFLHGNIEDLTPLDLPRASFQVAVMSHVLEMLESPECGLLEARKYTTRFLVIEFFEPPRPRADRVEIRRFSNAEGGEAYLRRLIGSREYQGWLDASGWEMNEQIKFPDGSELHVLKAA